MLVLMKHSDEKLGSRHFLVAHGVLQDARRCVGAEPSQLRVALPRRAVPDQARQGGRAARTPARPPRRRRLHQPGPAGEPRSAAEAELCTRAAEELYGLYLHPATWIIEMTSLPEDYPAAFTFAAAARPSARRIRRCLGCEGGHSARSHPDGVTSMHARLR